MILEYGAILATSLSLFASPAMAAEPAGQCVTVNVQEPPASVDMYRVRDEWIGWYNDYRATLGLPAYAQDATLDRTAGNWSYYSVKRGTIDHKRAWQAPYYDYRAIESWFKKFDVGFKNVGGVTFTENIGWGVYSCDEDDCTDELIASIRSTFDFFLGEKDKAYRSHYNTIVNGKFTKMGLGVAVDPAKKRYYLTAHFGTELTEAPSAFCGS
jgi:uncharacterized protein YkwD